MQIILHLGDFSQLEIICQNPQINHCVFIFLLLLLPLLMVLCIPLFFFQKLLCLLCVSINMRPEKWRA